MGGSAATDDGHGNGHEHVEADDTTNVRQCIRACIQCTPPGEYHAGQHRCWPCLLLDIVLRLSTFAKICASTTTSITSSMYLGTLNLRLSTFMETSICLNMEC